MKRLILLLLLHFSTNSFSQVIIYMNKEGGVYTVPCKINGLKLKFIFDTGCNDVSISLTEAIFMIKNDYLSENEIYGTTYARLANGDITENTQILLREIEIGGIKIYNIRASVVHELAAPLLLGQSAIEKLGAIQMEGSKLTILNKKGNSQEKSYDYPSYTYSSSSQTAYAPELFSNFSRFSYAYPASVYTCASFYNKPDMINGLTIGSACDGKVILVGKVGEDYFYIQYNNTYGYMWKGMRKN